jgi:hypothetical protein
MTNTDQLRAEFETSAVERKLAYMDKQHGVIFYSGSAAIVAWKTWQYAHAKYSAPALPDGELPPLPIVPDDIIQLLDGFRRRVYDGALRKHITTGEIVLKIRKAMREAIVEDRKKRKGGCK